METFKAYQNKLKEEEEIWKNQEARKRSSGLGKISPFSPFKRNSVDSVSVFVCLYSVVIYVFVCVVLIV